MKIEKKNIYLEGSCVACDKSTLLKGKSNLEYPYIHTYHLQIGNQIVRLCEDCKAELIELLQNAK